MDGEPSFGGEDYLEESFVLGDVRQRRILSILSERSRPIPTSELAVQIAALEADVPPTDVSDDDRRAVRSDLHHRCLPTLEAVGWVDRRSGGVVAADPLTVETRDLSLPDLQDPTDPAWDAVSVLVARPRRQELAVVIADRRHPVTVTELTDELRERDHSRWARFEDDRTVTSTLHHVDLPKLAESGLVEYDTGEGTVARTRRLLTLLDRDD